LGFRYPTLVGSYKVSHKRLWNLDASFVSLALRSQTSSNYFIIEREIGLHLFLIDFGG
jgi:hypothetical protein